MIFTGTLSMWVQYMPQFIPPLAQHMEVIHSRVLKALTQWFDMSGGSTAAVIGKLGICVRVIWRNAARDGERRRRKEHRSHIPDTSEGGPQGDSIVDTWGSQRKKTQRLMAKYNKKKNFISVQVCVIMNIVCLLMIRENVCVCESTAS